MFLLSAGADKRLCLWDITRGVLVGCYNEKGIEEVRCGPEMSWGEIGGGVQYDQIILNYMRQMIIFLYYDNISVL